MAHRDPAYIEPIIFFVLHNPSLYKLVYFKASVDSSSYHLQIKCFKNRRIEDSKNLKNAASLNRVKSVLH